MLCLHRKKSKYEYNFIHMQSLKEIKIFFVILFKKMVKFDSEILFFGTMKKMLFFDKGRYNVFSIVFIYLFEIVVKKIVKINKL